MTVTPIRARSATRIQRRAANDATYEERAKLHSTDSDGCWVWFGCVSNGVPRVGRRVSDGQKGPVNLRVALLEEQAERPEWAHSAVVTCGNSSCVNPDHLKWETKGEFFARVRQSQPTKISDERYRQAWDLHAEGMGVKELAARFAVSRQTLYHNWKRLGLRKQVQFVETGHGTADD